MASIPIHNETDYLLTNDMMQHILRDAQEHFGEEVSAIRVQDGIERHAFNARTHEVRYAFSPQDFGFGHTMPITPEPLTSERVSQVLLPPCAKGGKICTLQNMEVCSADGSESESDNSRAISGCGHRPFFERDAPWFMENERSHIAPMCGCVYFRFRAGVVLVPWAMRDTLQRVHQDNYSAGVSRLL